MENEGVSSSWPSEVDQVDVEKKIDKSRPSIGADLNTALQDVENDPDGGNFAVTSASGSSSLQTIRVYLRLKPFPLDIDLTREQENAYSIVNSTTLLTKIPGLDVNSRSLKNLKVSAGRVCRTFTFTSAFGPVTSQTELFDEAIKPQIADFLAGQSSTVMSYGTSNAGKSYTLYGVPEALGMIPLSISFIFREIKSTLSAPWFKPIYRGHVIGLSSTERIRELEIRDTLLSFTSPEKTEFVNAYQTVLETTRADDGDLTSRQNENVIYSVWITFAEIYNDVIYDLLSYDCRKKRLPLKMVTDKQGRTFIKDLSTVYVNSEEEAYQILLAGQYRSRIAATTLNPRSSRSHCIFTIKLLKYRASSGTEDVEVSAFCFCDLAGSGRLRMKTNIEDRLKETQNINTSLLVLGRCLKSIWEGQSVRLRSEPVGPFRESKLTRLFQKALSGKEQITLIVNVNPVPSLYAETQNVLNFSAIAKKIIVEPVKETKKIFRSRFSLVVSQSARTVTDWDHAAVDNAAEMYPENVKPSNYVHRECYDDLSAEFEKLKKEHATLKASMLEKDLEIREEMGNTYTRLLKDLEAGWRSRSKDVEQQQEHLLAWSISQVENFYKEKLNRLNSRKRRRWDDGDGVDDREADMREIETENASLTAKILVTKETIKELRSAREDAIADKNKAVFELSLVKEEIIGIKKMLEAAENDIQCGEDGACFAKELKKQLNSREDRIKNLKEFLNEAKEEYIRITSDAAQMQAELKEANANLIENAERIEDLEDQLDQANLRLAERDEEVEQLTEKLERRSKESTDFEQKATNFEKELKKSECIRLNLMGAVEDLNKLHKTSCANFPDRFHDAESRLTECDVNVNREIANIESENSPIIEHFVSRNRLRDLLSRDPSLGGLYDESIEAQGTNSFVDTESFYKESQSSFKLSGSSGIDDSGIAMTVGSGNQTMERINFTTDELPEVDERNSRPKSAGKGDENPGDCQFVDLQSSRGQFETTQVMKRSQKLEFTEQQIDSLGSCENENPISKSGNNSESIETKLKLFTKNKIAREFQIADVISRLKSEIERYDFKINAFQTELTTRMDKERFYCKCLNDKISRLERQLRDANVRVNTAAIKLLNQHGMATEKMRGKVFGFLERNNITPEIMKNTIDKDTDAMSELKHRLQEFEITLVKCQARQENQHKQLLDNVNRLSALEKQLQNWPIREFENTNGNLTLPDKLKTGLESTIDEVAEDFSPVNPDLHRPEDVEIASEPFSQAATKAEDNLYGDFCGFHKLDPTSDSQESDNFKIWFQDKEVKRIHRFMDNVASQGDEASINADYRQTTPASIQWGAASHSDAKSELTAGLIETSVYSPNRVGQDDRKYSVTENELYHRETDEDDMQPEPRQLVTKFGAREMLFILILTIVFLVGLM